MIVKGEHRRPLKWQTRQLRFYRSFVIIDRREAVRVNLTMELRRFLIALAVLIMCGGFLSAQTPSGSETGIEGVITISPIKAGPVRADAPSSDHSRTRLSRRRTKRARSHRLPRTARGAFECPLSPGHYKVSLKGRTSSIGRYGPFEVDVVAGQMTKVQWQCDSGMR